MQAAAAKSPTTHTNATTGSAGKSANIKRASSPTTAATTTKKLTSIKSSSGGGAGTAAPVTVNTKLKRNSSGGSGSNSNLTNDSANDEIKEISKKISEHADAIYRTWKSHGLAPTELLEFYTNATAENTATTAAGDFFVGNKMVGVDDANTLQSLVNTFVSKDKEQRGMKAANVTIKAHTTPLSKVKNNSNNQNNSNMTVTASPFTAISSSGSDSQPSAASGGKKLAQKNKTNASKSAVSPAEIGTTTTPSSPLSASHSAPVGIDVLNEISLATTATTVNSSKGHAASGVATTMAHTAISVAKKSMKNISNGEFNEKNAKIAANVIQQQQQQQEPKQQNLQKNSSDKLATLQRDSTNFASPQAQTIKTATSKPLVTSTELRSTPSNQIVGGDDDVGDSGNSSSSKSSKQRRPHSPLDLNFNLELNNLDDLKNLTHIQTENLKMIKELLQAECNNNNNNKNKSKNNNNNNNNASQVERRSKSPILSTTAISSTQGAPTTSLTPKLIKTKNPTTIGGKVKCNEKRMNDMASTPTSSSSSPSPSPSSDPSPIINNTASEQSKHAKATTLANNNTNGVDNVDEGVTKNAMKLKASTGIVKNLRTPTIPTLTAATVTATETTTPAANPLATNKTTHKLIKGNSNNNNSSSGNKSIKEKHTERKSITSRETVVTDESLTAAPATAGAAIASVMELARNNMPAPTKSPASAPTTATKFSNSSSSRSAAAAAAAANLATQLNNGHQDKYLGRPILTRGSVAERVLMFEKCPDVRNSFLNIKRPDPADAPPKSLLKAKLHSTPPTSQADHNSLQREIRNTKSVYIPRFYFPHGKPQPTIALERTLRGILSAFDSFPNNQVTKDELPRILKLCGLPYYWRMPVMVFCQQGNSGLVERQRYVEFWKQMNVYCHDAASRFVYILSRGQRFRSYIQPEDLVPLVQDVVDTHPGLAFLKEATEFHSRYVHTVIARIFYAVNRSWSGRITISELKKSDLLEIITLLEEEDDINQIMAFFSYEHFYVIYCKFWELDKDHDLLINQEDLARHSDHALSTRIVERIFSGCVTRNDNKKTPDDEAKMSYADFVWFLLSEEDKRTPTAIEYWFRCMDIDGDGVLSMYELEYFYEEQQQRMESIGIETLSFEDCLCQMLDMIKPQRRDCVSLGDLKRCKMTHVFFDTFFNLEKYLDHEQRDPFASQRDEYLSDWDRFAAQEYELLISEEND